MFALASCVCRI